MGTAAGTTPEPGSNTSISDPTALAQLADESTRALLNAAQDDPEDPGTGALNPRTAEAKMRRINSRVAAAMAKGFQLTPEQIEAQLTFAKQAIFDLGTDLRSAQRAEAEVYAPAPDSASTQQVNALKNWFGELQAVIRGDMAALSAWQAKVSQAKQFYLATERLTEVQWQRLAKGLKA